MSTRKTKQDPCCPEEAVLLGAEVLKVAVQLDEKMVYSTLERAWLRAGVQTEMARRVEQIRGARGGRRGRKSAWFAQSTQLPEGVWIPRLLHSTLGVGVLHLSSLSSVCK